MMHDGHQHAASMPSPAARRHRRRIPPTASEPSVGASHHGQLDPPSATSSLRIHIRRTHDSTGSASEPRSILKPCCTSSVDRAVITGCTTPAPEPDPGPALDPDPNPAPNPAPPLTSPPPSPSPSQTLSTSRIGPTSLQRQLYITWVLVFFAGSSLGTIFINKTCLTGYHFRYPLTLVLGQMVFAIVLLNVLHLTGYHTIPVVDRRELISLAVPTALFTSNVVVGLSALSLVNIPMFSAFRRLTLLFVMAAEYLFLNKTHSRPIMYTVVVMTIGAFISAIDDVTFSRLGYCLVFLNNVLTAGYLAAIKRAMEETGFDPLVLLYYTAIMGFPPVTLLLMATGELALVIVAFRTQPELVSWAFLASLFLTASGAFAVNFSTSLCTHVTSPLTTSVAGQLKNVLQTVLGFFSWGFVPTAMNTFGLLVALGAQMWFAYLKYRERDEGGADENEKEEAVGDEAKVLLGRTNGARKVECVGWKRPSSNDTDLRTEHSDDDIIADDERNYSVGATWEAVNLQMGRSVSCTMER